MSGKKIQKSNQFLATSRSASTDPKEVSRYYHEVMRDAIAVVKRAEAQSHNAQQTSGPR